MGVFFKRFGSKEVYTLSVGAIFHNEAPYLKEWIEYHRLVGVEHFFLYNNQSSDHYLEILTPYLEKKIVELQEWPTTAPEGHWLHAQEKAYQDCICKAKSFTKWLALIDIDEFLVPVQDLDLRAFLRLFEDKKSIGMIHVNWQLYGTSGIEKLAEDRLIIESFTKKAFWNYTATHGPDHRRVKSIVRPSAVKSFEIHTGSCKRGFSVFPEDSSRIHIDQIRINHYWTRCENYFREVKIQRRQQFNPLMSKEVLYQKLEDLDKVDDPILLRYVPELRKKIFRPLA